MSTHNLQVLANYITVPASTVVATTFTVGVIPAGMRVKSVELYTNGLGTSVTVSAGVTGSTTLFISGGDLSAAGKVAMTDTIAGGVSTRDEYNNRNFILTTAGATTTASAKVIYAVMTLIPDYV